MIEEIKKMYMSSAEIAHKSGVPVKRINNIILDPNNQILFSRRPSQGGESYYLTEPEAAKVYGLILNSGIRPKQRVIYKTRKSRRKTSAKVITTKKTVLQSAAKIAQLYIELTATKGTKNRATIKRDIGLAVLDAVTSKYILHKSLA
jgi:hypothetical protein